MATFNKKTVSKVSYSSVQVDDITSDKKAVSVLFEDGTQMVINGGLFNITNMITQTQAQISDLQKRLSELSDMQNAIESIK